jgi:hypothetical protein
MHIQDGGMHAAFHQIKSIYFENQATIMDQFIGSMMHQTNSLRCRFADGSFTPHTLLLPPHH